MAATASHKGMAEAAQGASGTGHSERGDFIAIIFLRITYSVVRTPSPSGQILSG